MNVISNAPLALKYRPSQLSEVVGQRAVVDILSAMLEKHFSGQMPLPTGMLFCGSRGTGKTTMARILSRILNCTSRDGLVSCGVCSSCKQIISGTDMSVIELDAASSGLVDDIRKLKELSLMAHSGNYRIFVLDEVHGMSGTAFQALLKIIEEPPADTLFIMATTEPQKIPPTIISRIMVFEYKRITEKLIVSRLSYIAEQEGIAVQDETFKAIASYVDGGMRDAVMALDQLRYVSDFITVDVFNEYYGVVGNAFYLDAVSSLVEGKLVEGLAFLEDAYSRSSDVGQLVDGFAKFFKDLLLVKYGAGSNFIGLAEKFSEEQLLALINISWDIRARVRHTGLNNKTVLDLMFVQFSRALGRSSAQATISSGDRVVDAATVRALFS